MLFLLLRKMHALSSLKAESKDFRINFSKIKAFEIILEKKLSLDVFFFVYKFGAV